MLPNVHDRTDVRLPTFDREIADSEEKYSPELSFVNLRFMPSHRSVLTIKIFQLKDTGVRSTGLIGKKFMMNTLVLPLVVEILTLTHGAALTMSRTILKLY